MKVLYGSKSERITAPTCLAPSCSDVCVDKSSTLLGFGFLEIPEQCGGVTSNS